MPPKKGNKKKGNDDWEADLGESIAPPAADSPDATAAADGEEEDAAGGGGLMRMLRKTKEKRKKKGLVEDFVEGEDSTAADGAAAGQEPDLAAKAPEEANLDDEFALPDKKAKGGKGKQAPAKAATPAAGKDADGDELGEGGKVLTKAEKEKLKKEREKQRKKEQVRDAKQ